MKNITIRFIALLLMLSLGSCIKPRIEPDFSIYGDKAFITGVTTFDYITVSHELNYNEEVTGYQVRALANTLNIDKVNFKINVLITNTAADLSKMGIRLSNEAVKIEPLNGAPAAGIIGDFSKGPYLYRVHSADGTKRDWTIIFSK